MSDINQIVKRIRDNWDPEDSEGATLEDALAEWINVGGVEIDDDGSVWISDENGGNGVWLSDREIAEWIACLATYRGLHEYAGRYSMPLDDVLSIDDTIVYGLLDSSAYEGDPERLGSEYLDEIVAQIPKTIAELAPSIRCKAIVGILTDDGDEYESIVRRAMHDVHRRIKADGAAV